MQGRKVALCFFLGVVSAWFMPVSAEAPLTYILAEGAAEPYQIVSTEEGVPHSGVLTDILHRLLAKTDYRLEPVVLPYKRIKVDLLNQRHDRWISYGSPTWLDERVLALGHYSDIPVLETPYMLVRMARAGDWALEGKRLIVIHGYGYFPSFHHWIKAHRLQLIQAPSHRHALAMLRQGRADYYMAEELRIQWQARQLDIPPSALELRDFTSIIPPSQVYFLFDRRLGGELRKQLNDHLRQMEETGELAELVARYY